MAHKITQWDPEDEQFWNQSGKATAYRNLWISIPCLLCAFAVWMYWSIIIVQMQNLGFPFSKAQLYTLTAIPGLLGATLRIPHSFLIALSGGRNVIAATTAMLIAPALGVGIALGDIHTSYGTFAFLSALSGIGGGAFASSMSNISFFFPKRMQGLSLGLNAGLGNVGVSVMQVLLPFVMTFGLFGALGGGRTAPAGGIGWADDLDPECRAGVGTHFSDPERSGLVPHEQSADAPGGFFRSRHHEDGVAGVPELRQRRPGCLSPGRVWVGTCGWCFP